MARVRLIGTENAPSPIREVFQEIEKNRFPVINLFKALAHCPHIAQNFIRLGHSILHHKQLLPRFRELAILRVAVLTGCSYEYSKHLDFGIAAGIEQDKINALKDWKESAAFSDDEKIVLQYTDEVALNARADDETFARLASILDEPAIVKLTVTIGYYAMVARILNTLQIELEDQST